MAKSITTELVTADTVETTSVKVSELVVTSDGNDLLVNNKEVAIIEDIPKLVYMTQSDYDAMSPDEIDPDTYYYTTNEEVYITKTQFEAKVAQIDTSISNLQKQITDLSDIITKLEARIAALEPSNDPEN